MNTSDHRGILSSFWTGILAAVGSNPAYFTAEPLFRSSDSAARAAMQIRYSPSSERKPFGGGSGSRRHRQWKRRRAAGWDRR